MVDLLAFELGSDWRSSLNLLNLTLNLIRLSLDKLIIDLNLVHDRTRPDLLEFQLGPRSSFDLVKPRHQIRAKKVRLRTWLSLARFQLGFT